MDLDTIRSFCIIARIDYGKSSLAKVDAHVIEPSEPEELPELTEEMLARAVVDKGVKPTRSDP